jgi:hypothetical protein
VSAYHERKLLWHKVCENLSLLPPPENELTQSAQQLSQSLLINNHKAEAAPLAANNTGIVIIEDYEFTTQPKSKSPLTSPTPASTILQEAELRRLEEQARSIKAAELTLPATENSDNAGRKVKYSDTYLNSNV